MGRLIRRWHYKHNLGEEKTIDLPETATRIDLIVMLDNLYGEGNWDYAFLKSGASDLRTTGESRVHYGL